MSEEHYTGACLCGEVKYSLRAQSEEIRGITACHCEQCRRWSGHHWASIHGPKSEFEITKGEASVKWYRSSDKARRGFCRNCGSALFWHGEGYSDLVDQMDISAGSLDNPKGLTLSRHIFCKFKGAYYEIKDGVPVFETFPKD
ncbi:MAG: GFA family protein [Acidimicrobiales bacterium]|nr:GFA family protein [Hyphomonadaceae bacterium]RZV44677.1 MAG: GFA family protein [Acidimicrobiales bacterium]